MNISHFCFILFNLKIFGEIVTTFKKYDIVMHSVTIKKLEPYPTAVGLVLAYCRTIIG